ncbi:hypothetical protein GCM10023328_45270 [Modestobacter marinus]|uniref:Uncharacterized protein n=1 Tax=Modestobacter marinus TaxID=477641 RepID=A0A846LX47_9ACTN|nr:hypothetical protein [Modestobacter marinus]NIH70078.1 hypothetical protein [Modestobacter marinus]GGL85942.1 hypothetical protein GCM10011589_47940 [Modestobacter marinus]
MSPLLRDFDEAGAVTGGVANGGDVDPDDRQLSVAEIQQAFRELRVRRPRAAATRPVASTRLHELSVSENPAPVGAPDLTPRRSWSDGNSKAPWARDNARCERWADSGDRTPSRSESGGDSAPAAVPGRGDSGALAADWITVVAAHAGAGASTVALAISDAAAATDRRVHLVETAHPRRSGLIAAASAELGTDAAGAWRRGSRDRVTIDRRVADVEPDGWPVLPINEEPAVTVLDLGLPAPDDLDRLAAGRTRTVVVCRPTVPGARLTEHLLSQLAEQPVVVAVVGAARWPQVVKANAGPRFRDLRSQGRVVRVPIDRRLQTAGLTGDRLPKGVEAAGRSLVALLMPAVPLRHRRRAASSQPGAAGEAR